MARPKSTPAPSVPADLAAAAKRGFPPVWLIAALAVLLGSAVIFALAGGKAPAVFATFIHWIFVLPVVAAAMLGLLVTEPFARRALFAHSPWPNGYRLLTATALGLGVFSLATLALGTIHLVEPAGFPWPPLVIPLAGTVIGYPATRRFAAKLDRSALTRHADRGQWLLILAAVPVAVLLIAATFPPGSLWTTEAHGYDVLEYHLQLPREYALNNSTAPLAHNVYSFFPANVEMLYLLQMQFAKTIMGAERDIGYLWGAFPAQFLHALLMLLAAAAVALFPIGTGKAAPSNAGAAAEAPPPQDPILDYASPAIRVPDTRWFGPTGRAVAVLLFLGVPWTIVTGSLAYNEAGMLLFGTLALGLALDAGNPASRTSRALLVGILLGLSLGCKMTAGVVFALPVALIYCVHAARERRQILALLLAAALAAAVYLPWAARAAFASGGNPVFPLATSLLPRTDWSAEQAARFTQGHAPPAGITAPAAALRQLVQNSLLDSQWSVQPYPVLYALLNAKEDPPADLAAPWKRVGLLWLALPLALAGALITRPGRSDAHILLAVAALQVLVWLLFTHQQARFLLPVAVPLAILAGRGVQGLHTAREQIPIAALRIVAGTLVAFHALGVAFFLLAETGLLGGVMVPPRTAAPPEPPIGELFSRVVNLAQALEDPDGTVMVPPPKVLLLGEARAWFYTGDVEYFTTFDSHPFLRELADPKRALVWLHDNRVRYLLVNWSEVQRLRNTYGFDPAVTRDAITALVTAGAEDTHQQAPPAITILRIRE